MTAAYSGQAMWAAVRKQRLSPYEGIAAYGFSDREPFTEVAQGLQVCMHLDEGCDPIGHIGMADLVLSAASQLMSLQSFGGIQNSIIEMDADGLELDRRLQAVESAIAFVRSLYRAPEGRTWPDRA